MKNSLLLSFSLLISSSPSWAYDCDSNCHEEARFRYSCPNWEKPDRICDGENMIKLSACEVRKAASCKLWNSAVNFFSDSIRPLLQESFNADAYHQAQISEETAQYLAQCAAAAAASCVVIGTQYGGPWGAVIGGAGGTFVSYQICKQSTKW